MNEQAMLVIVPTYNEAESIPVLLSELSLLCQDFSFLVVDDGSPDGTADIVRKLQIEFEGRIHIEVRHAPT